MARSKNTSKPTGAQLRAMRDQRLEAGAREQEAPRARELRLHEEAIERGLKSFIEIGRHLAAINGDRLFEDAGFKTFEQYVERRLEISRQHAYRIIDASRVALAVSPNGDKIKSEAVARELVPLGTDQEKLHAVFAEAERRAESGRVTAALVREVREEQASAHAPRDAGQEESGHPPAGSSTPTAAGVAAHSGTPVDGAEGHDSASDDAPVGDGGVESSAAVPGTSPETTAGPTVATTAVDPSRIEGSPGEGSGVRPDPSPLDHPGANSGVASAEGGPSASGARSRLREGEMTAGVQVSPEPEAPAVAQDQELSEWVHDLTDVIGRLPEPSHVLDLSQDLLDALLNALVDLDEWRDDLDALRTQQASR